MALAITDEIERACASFAGGFLPEGTDAIVVVSDREDEAAKIRVSARAAPATAREAVVAISESCGIDMDRISAAVYVLCGGCSREEE
ncbi:unnamed protein product [Pylaiella littoralis]